MRSLPPLFNLRRTRAVALFALLTLVGEWLTPAANITFSTPANCAADTDVFTGGTLLAAYTWGTAATVNGVAFTASTASGGAVGGYLSLSSFGSANATAFTSTSNPFNALSTAYKNVLKGSVYGATNTTATVTLVNLIPYHQYAVQVWVGDPRSGSTATRVQTITDAAGSSSQLLDFNSLDAVGGVGQYTIGTFTADATTQQFRLASSGYGKLPQINLIQLRDVTTTTTNAYWSGTTDGTWADSDTTSQNFTGTSFSGVKALGIPGVYFDDNDGNGNPVTRTNISIGAGGVYGVDTVLLNNSVQYRLSSSDTVGISGFYNLWKVGSGTATLEGTHTYSGTTTVNGGILNVAGSIVGGGAVTVSSGKLSVSGQVASSGVTLSGGILALSGGDDRLSTYTPLTFAGSGILDLGTNSQTLGNLTLAAAGITATITNGGTLTLNSGQNLVVGSPASGTSVLDLSGVSNFVFYGPAADVNVGGQLGSTASVNGTMNLATNSTITAKNLRVQNVGTTSTGTTVNTGILNLGKTTTLYVNSISTSPDGRDNGYIQYGWAITNPTLSIRAADGVSRANITVGSRTTAYGTTETSKIDLTNNVSGTCTLDALVGTLSVGSYSRGSSQTENASFLMGGGTLDATTIILGTMANNNGNNGVLNSTLSLSGGTVKVGTLTMGNATASQGTLNSTFSFNGGTVLAQTIQGGTATATRLFHWNDGTLANYDANTDLTIGAGLTLTLDSTGTHTFAVGAGRTATVNAVLGGTGANLTKTGNGTLMLNGANTYTGTTTISGGKCYINGAVGDGVVVSANATLGGLGTVTGQAVVYNGGAVEAGISGSGTLTVNSLSLGTGPGDTATIDVTCNDSPAILNVVYLNGLAANGGNNSVTINVGGAPPPVGQYPLITFSGSIGGSGVGAFQLGSLPPHTQGYLTSTATSIDLVVTASSGLLWSGALSAEWSSSNLLAPKNWLLTSDGVTQTDFAPGDRVLFDDSAANTTVDVSVADVAPGSMLFSNSSKNYTVTGMKAITGAAGLTKRGTGSVTLANVNTYSGSTVVSNGTLIAAADPAFAGGALVQGGTLQLGNGGNAGSVTGNIVDNGQVTLNRSDDITFNNAVSGTGSIVKQGNNTVTLAGANSHTGGLAINAGSVKLSGATPLGANGAQVTISSGASLDFNGDTQGNSNGRGFSFTVGGSGPDGSGALVNSSATQVLSYANISNLTLTADTVVGGAGARWDIGPGTNSMLNGNGYHFTKSGAGTLDVRPQIVTNVADVTVSQGILFYEGYSQTNAWTAEMTNYVQPGATLGAYGSITLNLPLVLDGATLQSQGSGTPNWSGPVWLASSSIFGSSGGNELISGNIAGPGGVLVTNGTSTVIFAGTNTYLGGTVVGQGTLQIGTATQNGTLPGDVEDNGTLSFQVVSNTTLVYGGVISGTGALTENNIGGTLILTGSNTFSGNVTINAGALWITNASALGMGTKTVTANYGTTGHPELHLDGASGNILLPSSISFLTSWNGGVLFNEAGDNEIDGNFTLTSGGGNTYIVSRAGTLTLAGNFAPSTTSRNLLLGGPGNGVVSGVIADGSGANLLAGVSKTDAGTWTLAGANTYAANTTVSGGTLLIDGYIGTGGATVMTNAILGGSGTIGGNVTVQAGGVLQGGNAVLTGTLSAQGVVSLGTSSDNTDVTHTRFNIAAGGKISAGMLNVVGTNLIDILDPTLSVGTNDLVYYTGAIGGNGFSGFQLGVLPPGITANLLDTGSAIQLAVTSVQAVPSITLDAPVSGGTYAAYATIPLSATVLSNGISITAVEFLTNGMPVAMVTTPPYSANWTLAAPGTYAVSARALYPAGQAKSASAIVTVNPVGALNNVSGGKKDANGYSFSFSGPNGQHYTLLGTTNVALPLSQWETNGSGFLTGSPITYTNSALGNEPKRFYRVRSP